ncbi:hypothetical protein OAH15_00880 [bacterium]|nr:hypothetical protein [bacterium]
MKDSITNFFQTMTLGGVFLGLAGCAEAPKEKLPLATLDELQKEDGVLRLKSTGELFKGYLVEYYPSNKTNKLEQVEDGGSQLKSRSVIRGGKLNGLSEGWYTDGQQQVAEVFVDGKSHGVRLKWHRNGQKTAEDSIVKGELNGPCYKWHDNGQLAEEMVMVDGLADGQARSWHQDGSQKAQVTLEMGKVIEQKFWEEAEKPGEISALGKL